MNLKELSYTNKGIGKPQNSSYFLQDNLSEVYSRYFFKLTIIKLAMD